jgi:peptidoglycan/xylan/chitin deacetylase (PgdA/CDA1 family)
MRGGLFGGLVAAALGLGLSPAARATAPTVVSLTFDDSLASQYQTDSMLAARGMHGTFYVNSGRVGLGGYMTEAQLLTLQSDGNEIAGHTVNHLDLSTVDRAEQERQICDDRSTLLGWGLSVTDFAYPFGSGGGALAKIVSGCGYNSARDDGGLTSAGLTAEGLPPADPFSIKTEDNVVASTSLADLEGAVTRAEQAGGGWVIFVMHNVCDACGTYAVSPTTLAGFLDWLAPRAAAGTSVKTVRDVIGGDVKAPVPGPPLPAVRRGNMLLNASLESDADGSGFPDCWQQNSWGGNSSHWTRTTDAHKGHFAEQVHVTSYTSGAVRLLSQQDLGYCAPTARAGDTYKLGVWYKGTVPPRLVAFFRNGAGAWQVLGQSAHLAQSATWRHGSWTAPALPPGANGVGIAVAVDRVGSLTMDDLSETVTATSQQ